MDTHAISIFFASDDNYARPMAVTLASVVANAKSFVNFYILENKISKEVKDGIEEIKKNLNNFSVEYIPVDFNVFKNFPDRLWYSMNMYSRFLIPYVKENLDKALYLDSDIIVQKDIKPLFDVDLEGHAIGVAVEQYRTQRDEAYFEEHSKNLGLDENHIYFNSGMLLMDCEKWRKENILNKLAGTIDVLKDKLKLPDQDALNVLFENNYKTVENKYYIHYSGVRKPWQERDMPQADVFWEYAKLTPFYDELYKNSLQGEFAYLRFWAKAKKKI